MRYICRKQSEIRDPTRPGQNMTQMTRNPETRFQLCHGRKEGLGTCPTLSCIEKSLPPLKSDINVRPLKSVLLFMLFIFRL